MFQIKELFNIAVEVIPNHGLPALRITLHAGDVLRVTLDHQADVRLLDDANYALLKAKSKYESVGGHATKSPVVLVAPSDGHWNLIIDAGDHTRELHASVDVLKK